MFRERNPLPLGIVTVATIAAVLLAVLHINSIVGAFGSTYRAELPEAAGLKQGDPVIVSGLKVGRVKAVELGKTGGGVIVTFTVNNGDVTLGAKSKASVSVETVLGDKSFEVVSDGGGTLKKGSTIPLSRTSAPYDISEVLTDLTNETTKIDTAQLAKALDTVSDTVDASAPEIEHAFTGVSRLSETIASRDSALRELLDHADAFSEVLADRSEDLTRVVRDGNTLFKVLAERRDEIHALLVNVTAMTKELRGVVKDNKKTLKPTLRSLDGVLATLKKNEANIDKALRGVSIYATGLGEVVSSGEFFTAYLQNLLPGNLFPPALDMSGLDLGGLPAGKPSIGATGGAQ
jgi:phospholipid/cholesterol/gamma-HCH transport system substrate-binding protein